MGKTSHGTFWTAVSWVLLAVYWLVTVIVALTIAAVGTANKDWIPFEYRDGVMMTGHHSEWTIEQFVEFRCSTTGW